MKTIWEFIIPIQDEFELKMPEGAKVLTAFIQTPNKKPSRSKRASLWAEVDTTAPIQTRRFSIIGTGDFSPTRIKKWIATFQDGPFIWHLYELT